MGLLDKVKERYQEISVDKREIDYHMKDHKLRDHESGNAQKGIINSLWLEFNLIYFFNYLPRKIFYNKDFNKENWNLDKQLQLY
jgi:hypothetical protein